MGWGGGGGGTYGQKARLREVLNEVASALGSKVAEDAIELIGGALEGDTVLNGDIPPHGPLQHVSRLQVHHLHPRLREKALHTPGGRFEAGWS